MFTSFTAPPWKSPMINHQSSTINSLTAARLNAELGAYYSTLGSTSAREKARKHLAQYAKAEKRLLDSGVIKDKKEIFAIPWEEIDSRDLSALSIAELEALYRQHPLRVEARIAQGLSNIHI